MRATRMARMGVSGAIRNLVKTGDGKVVAVFADFTEWEIYREKYKPKNEMMRLAWPVEDGEPILLFARENGAPLGKGEYKHRDAVYGLLDPNHPRIVEWMDRPQYVGNLELPELEGDAAELFENIEPAPTTPTLFYHDLNGGYLERLRPRDLHADQTLKDIASRYFWGALALTLAGLFVLFGQGG